MLNRSLAALLSSVLLGALFIGAPTSVRAGSTIYVGPGRGSGGCASPDYQTDGTADNEQIENAVNTAASGDTIYLCAGSFDIADQVHFGSKNLTFQGAGKSRTILDAHERDTRFFNSDSPTVIFRDLTMQNANQSSYVGAIWGDDHADITIQRSAFLNNYAADGMGVVFSRRGNITVSDSSFVGNYSDSRGDLFYGGGAITASGEDSPDVSVTIRNSTFTGNYSVGDGGAILSRGSLSITNSIFVNNETEDDGGAIAVYGDLQVNSSSFSGNITHSEGASIYVECNTRMQVSGSTFNDNHAVGSNSDGGAFNIDCTDSAYILINRNIFSNNTADDAGGVLDEDSLNTLNITNNRFIKNSSKVENNLPDGGGAIWASYIRMTGNVFIGNTSEGCGGAVYVLVSDFGTARSNTYSANRGRVGGVREMNVCFWTPK